MWKSQILSREQDSNAWWKCNVSPESSNQWPFRLKLTTDNLRWDSLKIPPSREFEEHVVLRLNEVGRRALEAWTPVQVFVHDVDTGDTYQVELAKKESFWFDPLPLRDDLSLELGGNGSCFCDLARARQHFAYSIQPFRGIKKKRGLEWDQEIALRWSGSKSFNKFDFSVVRGIFGT